MTSSRDVMKEISSKLAELTDETLFGDVWERPELSKRDRSLITVAVLQALYRTGQLPGHLNRALDNGVTKEELGELITHVAFYAGWPTAANVVPIAKEVFDGKGE
ncbi:MAG TPA: carboxymuconolactone decarboxylase family protein [Dehalococcoidia bacterium]|mgnify:CR=1 FL=1|jgi:4-carboxymuconolactone decarboxylase|nr:carboxymuconolactone decarboxylase family protein [Dehalococcoidia bacterium]